VTKYVTVLTPVADRAVVRGRLAPRVVDLAGLKVGLLDNGKPNADLFLDHIAEQLTERFSLGEVVRRRKSHTGRGAEHLNELAAHSDVVINGVGD